MAEIDEARERGQTGHAIDLLYDLTDQCHRDARSGVSDWHEIQTLSLLASLLVTAGNHAYAAREYRRVARFYRDALRDASTGLGPAVAAQALCEDRAGRRRPALKLALEALRLHSDRPLPSDTLGQLRLLVERLQTLAVRRSKKPLRRKPRGVEQADAGADKALL